MAGNRSMAAIGIDLGTTYSCVAIWQQGRVEIIANDQGNRITPSCVAFTTTDHLIGDAAQNQCHSNPTNTIFGVKRLIGRKYRDESVQNQIKLLPYKLEAGEDDKPQIVVQYKGETKRFCAEEISSMILTKMRTIAETFLGSTVTDAVITVPAYFNDAQRRATKDAGHIAGLNVMRIINEPTAAAVAYGLDKSVGGGCGKNVLIFDLGGGTFDVSILWMEGSVLEVKATAGDTYLGGEDFDERMVRYLVEEFRKKNGGKDMSDSPKALRRLRTACEKAKRLLSFTAEAEVDLDCLYAGTDFLHRFTRAKFEELNMDLFEKCMDVVRQCLKDAKMVESNIDNVVLVGGSTRIPKVQELLQDLFRGKELSRSINPDEAVAYGAAVQAAKLTGKDTGGLNDLILLDITPLSLGISKRQKIMSMIIPRNTPIPAKRRKTYVTVKDNQTAMRFNVYEGERGLVTDNNFLGGFSFGGLPALPAGQAEVDVSFNVDADSILTVIVGNRQSGAMKEVTIVNERDTLSAEQIDWMIEEAERYRVEDEERKEKAASRSLLESFIYNIRSRIRRGSLGIEVSAATERILNERLDKASRWLEDHPNAEASELERRRKELEMVFDNLQSLSSLMKYLRI